MKHATIDREGYRVPLIGIPAEAVMDECQCCHDTYPLSELVFSYSGQLLCEHCRIQDRKIELCVE